MRYVIDHDYHLRPNLLFSAPHPLQAPENILNFARNSGLKQICFIDYWGIENISDTHCGTRAIQERSLHSTTDEDISCLCGCEFDLYANFSAGISSGKYDLFDFIIIAATDLQCLGCAMSREEYCSIQHHAELWCEQFNMFLDIPLPFQKIGISHLPCSFIDRPTKEQSVQSLNRIPPTNMEFLFKKIAKLGIGIEINFSDMKNAMQHPKEILRPYRIAKICGCKFYLGSDAYTQAAFTESRAVFDWAIDALNLQESDKYIIEKHRK